MVEGSDGVEVTGQVKIKVGGDTITKTLKDGKLKLNLGKFATGKHKVKVTAYPAREAGGCFVPRGAGAVSGSPVPA